MNTAKAK